jgi:hypothetical protein
MELCAVLTQRQGTFVMRCGVRFGRLMNHLYINAKKPESGYLSGIVHVQAVPTRVPRTAPTPVPTNQKTGR